MSLCVSYNVVVYEHHRCMALYIPGPRRTYYITAHPSHYSNVMAVNITQHVHVMTIPVESARHCCMNIEFSSLYGVESWVFLYHRFFFFMACDFFLYHPVLYEGVLFSIATCILYRTYINTYIFILVMCKYPSTISHLSFVVN